MNEFKSDMKFPTIAMARVMNYDPEHNSVYVELPSGQSPALPVRMSYRGNADQYRIEQEPLPLVGTWGIVAFPGGDDRFGVWLGSFYSNITDAITSSSVLQDSQIKYFSHWSGYYSILDGQGNSFCRLPEGTTIIANVNNKEPQTWRHVFSTDATTGETPTGPQIRVQLKDAERVPAPPPVFWLSVNHPSKASASCSPSGLVTIQAGQPALASITMTPSGIITVQTGSNQMSGTTGPMIILDAVSGNLKILGQSTSGSSSEILLDPAGNIKIISSRDITIDASNDGDIFLKTTEHPAESLDNIIDTFNAHVHSGVQPGSGDSGPPTTPLP